MSPKEYTNYASRIIVSNQPSQATSQQLHGAKSSSAQKQQEVNNIAGKLKYLGQPVILSKKGTSAQ